MCTQCTMLSMRADEAYRVQDIVLGALFHSAGAYTSQAHLNSSRVSSVNLAVLLSARLVAAPLNSAAPLLLAELASSAWSCPEMLG